MRTMRRRGRSARGGAAAQASSQGKASDTPEARRKVRRERLMGGPRRRSFALKRLALHDLVDERPQAVLPVANLADDALDGRPVVRGGVAGGVGQELLGQGAGELVLVLQEQLLQL